MSSCTVPRKGRRRQLIIGINWSPAIRNPSRAIFKFNDSLDAVLSRQ